jgi:magnesium-transporting ATPase (P-type)
MKQQPLQTKPTLNSNAGAAGAIPIEKKVRFSDEVLKKAYADSETVLKELGSQWSGLSGEEAASRLQQYGLNEIARARRLSPLMRLLVNFKNPLVCFWGWESFLF